MVATFPTDAGLTRKPDRNISFTADIPTKSVEYIAGYEKRRLISRRSKRTWNLTYTNILGSQKTLIENFWIARSGSYEAFSFNLSHINETGLITVRFDGPINYSQVVATSNANTNIWTLSFNLKEVDD